MTQQEQPYPQTNLNLSPDGLTITITLAPGLALMYGVSNEALDAIELERAKQRVMQKPPLELINHVHTTRNA